MILPSKSGGSASLTVTKIGSYDTSSARSINVSAYLKTGDTVNNFWVQPTRLYGYVDVYGTHYGGSATANAYFSKSLSGTTLSISGLRATANSVSSGTAVASSYLFYDVYYVGIA